MATSLKLSGHYTQAKAAWHLDRIAHLRHGLYVVPVQLYLILSDLCNHDCSFCCHRISDGLSSENFAVDGNHNPNRKIPTDKAIEILLDAAEAGIKAVQFTGGGEPTVHPEHLRIFTAAQNLGLSTGLVTNGYLLRDGWEDVYSRFDWIRVSLDAGIRETYALIRKVPESGFGRTLENIRRISDCGPGTLGVSFVVTLENWREIVEASFLAREYGASNIRIGSFFGKGREDYYRGIDIEQIRKLISTARSLFECDSFTVHSTFDPRMEDLQQGAPDYEFCGQQQIALYIGGDQKVYRCCNTAYTHRGEIADLSSMRLRYWLTSSERATAYQGFDARGCQLCMFNEKNRLLGYLSDPKPEHVEFA